MWTQRAFSDATRQFQAKLMLFYVLHEFLKSFQGEQLLAIQREWFQTVDDILHACVRDLRNNDDGRKRLFKVRTTLPRPLFQCSLIVDSRSLR